MGGHPPYPQRRPPAVPPGKRGSVRLRQLAMSPKKDNTCLYVSLGIAALFFFLIVIGIIGVVCWKFSSNDAKDDYERAFRAGQASKPNPEAPAQTKVVEKIIEREVPARSSYPPPRYAQPPPRKRSSIGRSFGKACAWGAGLTLGAGLMSKLIRRRLPEKSE